MINNIENKIEYLQKCSLKNRCFWKLDFLLEKFLEPEELTGANRWFFPSCNYLTNSTKEIKIYKGRNYYDRSVAALHNSQGQSN